MGMTLMKWLFDGSGEGAGAFVARNGPGEPKRAIDRLVNVLRDDG